MLAQAKGKRDLKTEKELNRGECLNLDLDRLKGFSGYKKESLQIECSLFTK
jgi:hypothetical protein